MRRLTLLLSVSVCVPAAVYPQVFDFQVNQTVGSEGIPHEKPTLVPTRDGGALVVWMDGRNGPEQVFGQFFSGDGGLLGGNFIISDVPLELSGAQSIGFDASGRLLIARTSYQGNSYQLSARRYSDGGAPLGPFFRLDDDPNGAYKTHCIVACDSAGGFAAAWSDTRNGRWYDLYLQRFDAAGRPLTRNIRINDNENEVNLQPASIALDRMGRCAVVWIDDREGWDKPAVYLRQFNPDGSAVRSNVKVDYCGSGGLSARVCIDENGNAVVLHESESSGGGIAISRYSEQGDPFGRTDYGQLNVAYGARKFLRGDGAFLLAWDGWHSEDPSIGYTTDALKYRIDGSEAPDIFNVMRAPEDSWGLRDILLQRDGTSFFAWTGPGQHVYVQARNASGQTRYGDVKASGDTLGGTCNSPSISVDRDGGFAVAWAGGYRDILVSTFDSEGRPRSRDVNAGAQSGRYPVAIFGPEGDLNVFWKVAGTRVDGRHFDRNGAPADSIRTFTDRATCNIVTHAAANASGNTVVVWHGDPGYEKEGTDVCVRRCGPDGIPLGPIIRVNEYPSEASYTQPLAAVAPDGGFLAVWTDVDKKTVRARLYDPEGQPKGGSYDVLSFLPGDNYPEEFVFSEPGGGFSVFLCSAKALRGQRLGPDGSAAGDPQTLLEGETLGGNVSDDMDMDPDGNFVLVLKQNNGIVVRIFNADWTARGRPFMLTEGAAIYGSISAKMRKGRIYAAWGDIRTPERGINIWASVTDAATGVRISETAVPAGISLAANYPNPFNPATTLSYELARPAKVSLDVFDGKGRKVRTIEDGFAHAGRHESRWDGRNDAGLPVPSGMYVFKLESDGAVLQRKAMLVR
jgi:hypothetical protein